MDFSEALKKAGIGIPQKPTKIDRKNQTIEIKINSVRDTLRYIKRYIIQYNAAPDRMEQIMAMDGMATRINEYVQFIIDIMHIVYNNDANNKSVAKNMSLNWAIRQVKSYLSLSSDEEVAIDKLLQRNEVEHEYVNSKYNKQNLMDYVITSGRYAALTSIVDKIENYTKANITQ